MGTTLSHGVYLPDEGERNCYAGLKLNWEILDQKVADISALQSAIAGALHREIVASLPTTDIDPNTIYMILSGTSATENVYNEFMYVNNAWELIGTSATDLTNYYTKSEVDGKLLLKANESDLTSHTGDTTIHVTANDKSKWNTVALIKQLRLVNTQVGSATTIAFSDIDDTNGIKVGDKCMDLDAKMFEITAVDIANQTVTVGSALIDLALDSNVVHTSGNETVGGQKTFTDALTSSRNVTNGEIILQNASYDPKTNGQGGVSTKSFSVNFVTALSDTFGAVSCFGVNDRTILRFTSRYFVDSQTVTEDSIEYNVYSDGTRSFKPRSNNNCLLGESTRKWKEVYATNYYYGSSNTEFSTKFVTTDTNQSISGEKTFNDLQIIGYGTQYKGARNAYILPEFSAGYSGLSITTLGYGQALKIGNFVLDANNKPTLDSSKAYIQIATGENNSVNACILEPRNSTSSSLGTSSNKWNIINGLTPSSLGMPVTPSSTSYLDISGYITVLDSSAPNTYTPPSNGYITFSVTGNLVQIFHDYGLQGKWTVQAGSANRGFIPVLGGVEVKIYVTASVVDKFWFIPCQGNV